MLHRNLFFVDNDYCFLFCVQNIHSKHALPWSNNTNNLSKSNYLIEIYYIVLVKHTKLYGGEILRIYHIHKTHISLTNGGLCPYWFGTLHHRVCMCNLNGYASFAIHLLLRFSISRVDGIWGCELKENERKTVKSTKRLITCGWKLLGKLLQRPE